MTWIGVTDLTYFTASEEAGMAGEGVTLFFGGFSNTLSIDFVCDPDVGKGKMQFFGVNSKKDLQFTKPNQLLTTSFSNGFPVMHAQPMVPLPQVQGALLFRVTYW